MTAPATNVTVGDLAYVRHTCIEEHLHGRVVTVVRRLYGGERVRITHDSWGVYSLDPRVPADAVVWEVRLREGDTVAGVVELKDKSTGQWVRHTIPINAGPVRDADLRRIAGPNVPLPAEELAAPGPGEQPVEQASGIGSIECTVEFPFVGVPA